MLTRRGRRPGQVLPPTGRIQRDWSNRRHFTSASESRGEDDQVMMTGENGRNAGARRCGLKRAVLKCAALRLVREGGWARRHSEVARLVRAGCGLCSLGLAETRGGLWLLDGGPGTCDSAHSSLR
ncbi:hypothetical protein NDU88_007203 [Pleurodeles waltl]|uniref:Uncharacterized protein n=1 Tax=Pleurodeles waltl TaxID=8319 RepID=A0AAV7UN63_PLEWA|nr:hypothetical protein NDU88_007203 [Pleurodeles waltl]